MYLRRIMRNYSTFCCFPSAVAQRAIENAFIVFFSSSDFVLHLRLWAIERVFLMFTRPILSSSHCDFAAFPPIGRVYLLLSSIFGVAAIPYAASETKFSFGGVVGKSCTSEYLTCSLSSFVFGNDVCVSLSLS